MRWQIFRYVAYDFTFFLHMGHTKLVFLNPTVLTRPTRVPHTMRPFSLCFSGGKSPVLNKHSTSPSLTSSPERSLSNSIPITDSLDDSCMFTLRLFEEFFCSKQIFTAGFFDSYKTVFCCTAKVYFKAH